MLFPGTRKEAMLKNAQRLVSLLTGDDENHIFTQENIAMTMKELEKNYYDRDFEGEVMKGRL